MAKKKKPLLLLLPLLLLPPQPLLLLMPLLPQLPLQPLLLLPQLLKARRSNSSSLNAGALHRHFSQEKARQLAGFFFGEMVWISTNLGRQKFEDLGSVVR